MLRAATARPPPGAARWVERAHAFRSGGDPPERCLQAPRRHRGAAADRVSGDGRSRGAGRRRAVPRTLLRRDRQDAPGRPHVPPRLVRAHRRFVSDGAAQPCRVERRQAMSPSRRLGWQALALGLALAIAGSPADAVEAPPGSKNFTPPRDVPNYFSNESGPFQGGANARNTQSDTAPILASPSSRGRAGVSARRN